MSARPVICACALLLAAASTSARAQETAGREAGDARITSGLPLTEALRRLQALGLRLVFSSAVVSPDLRVAVAPRSADPRTQLDELLAPHGLEAREGPAKILQVVRAPAQPRPPPAGEDVAAVARPRPPSAPQWRFRDHIEVPGHDQLRRDPGLVAESRLASRDLAALHGSLAEDPLRVAQALPRVTAVDDFSGDFVVRGSPFRHAALVIDGVATSWLRHSAPGSAPSGSITMLSGLLVEEATLRTGAYPRRNGDRLGAEFELTLREGSRRAAGVRAALGGTHAMLVGEGPIGGAAANARAPGSWLVAARHSLVEWPPERNSASRAPFGFSDGMAKIVFDASARHQVGLTVLAGLSRLDADDDPGAVGPIDGARQASLVTVSWRSTLGAATILRQQAYRAAQASRTVDRGGGEWSDGVRRVGGYRADITRALGDSLLEAGAHVERISAVAVQPALWNRSGYVNLMWSPSALVRVSPGVRVTWSTLTGPPALSRWVLAEWTAHARWRLLGSAGVTHQDPDAHGVTPSDIGRLPAEQAVHLDAGVEYQVSNALRWQVSLFSRREDDVHPDVPPPLPTGGRPEPRRHDAALLTGTAHGVEVVIERSSRRRFSGWAAYSYGRTRQTDPLTAETYWADRDQRHAVNLLARCRLSSATTLGATFRSGSNFPVPGYLAEREGRLVAGATRNALRLPPYARLDLRADHRFTWFGRELTVFTEALNVLNRRNLGAASGRIDHASGTATGFVDPQLRRRVAAGVLIDF